MGWEKEFVELIGTKVKEDIPLNRKQFNDLQDIAEHGRVVK